jgi:hypothetical protein
VKSKHVAAIINKNIVQQVGIKYYNVQIEFNVAVNVLP